MKKRAYKVVDVFTSHALLGNPVAVVLDAEGLDELRMQAIARWINLSETTFLLPPSRPEADYRLRIFTPRGELPFAGHPTLGSAHAAIEAGRVKPRNGKLVQECGAGLVDLAVMEEGPQQRLMFVLPSAKSISLSAEDTDELEIVLGHPVVREITPACVNVGPIWIVAGIEGRENLLGLKPDFRQCAAFTERLGATGLTLYSKCQSGDAAIEVRSFAPSCGVNEDPVCGSGNGSVAVFLWQHGLLPASGACYTASQGQCLGRDGRITVQVDARGKVILGGACITTVDGVIAC